MACRNESTLDRYSRLCVLAIDFNRYVHTIASNVNLGDIR